MSGAAFYQILLNSSDVNHLDWSIPLLLFISRNSFFVAFNF